MKPSVLSACWFNYRVKYRAAHAYTHICMYAHVVSIHAYVNICTEPYILINQGSKHLHFYNHSLIL
jgi:hypothetical protein